MLVWKKRPPRADPSAKPRDHFSGRGWDLISIARTIHELDDIHEAQMKAVRTMGNALARVPEENRASARNLAHYLALRTRDIRGLQEALASMGLSSLGRAEGHAMYNVRLLLKHLHHLLRHSWDVPPDHETVLTRHEAHELLKRRADALLGTTPSQRSTRIMVTMPSEAARDYAFVRDLVANGMNVMRINCAHDGPAAWQAMVAHLRRAQEETGNRCRVLMDLGGPKIRTGPLAPGPSFVKWKPRRDGLGRPTSPARVWLTPADAPEPPPETPTAVLPLSRDWLAGLQPGDSIRFHDARDTRRKMSIAEVVGASRWAHSDRTCYVTPGTRLVRFDAAGQKKEPTLIGDLPRLDDALVLKEGDRLLLTKAPEEGRSALVKEDGRLLSPARISCTLPDALENVRPGEVVRFDDGKIDGRVLETNDEGLLIAIDRAQGSGAKLGSDKGINFPGSDLSVPGLTEKDIQDLSFIARHADMVGLSFVRDPEDVRELRRRLNGLGGERLGVVLKIETQAAFDHLPSLLLAALEAPTAGIMIARGDLAIECGYERLAELQEEILWLCEAAHLPVIWATQVLESLAKDGQASRAEITDAAMGERAECVMLNKGPHVVRAVLALDDIIRRMETHQSKKTPTFRPLRVAQEALNGGS